MNQKQKDYNEAFNTCVECGFQPQLIKDAWVKCNGDKQKMIDTIIAIKEQTQKMLKNTDPKNIAHQDQDAKISQAIQKSLEEAKLNKHSFEPLNPEQRIRKSGIPVGLKNVGNSINLQSACYFNSLLQTYFMNKQFTQEILKFKCQIKKIPDDKKQQFKQLKKNQSSIITVKKLQMLFCHLIGSDKKYVDPVQVIESIVDEQGCLNLLGNNLVMGDQKDVGQYNVYFLSRVIQGLNLSDNSKKKELDNIIQQNYSPKKVAMVGQKEDQMSNLKRSNSLLKISDNSISNDFFGKLRTRIRYQNQQEEQGVIRSLLKEKTEEELFTCLFLDVKHHELYKSIEQITMTNLLDYRNEKGEKVNAVKECFISKQPESLFFQIQRVTYDSEKGKRVQLACLKKINDKFTFPKIFYIDCFLQKNKKESLVIRQRVNQLRKEKQNLQKALKELNQFKQSPLSLNDVLFKTRQFLQVQINGIQSQDFIHNPAKFPLTNKKLIQQMIPIFKSYQGMISQRKSFIIDKLRIINQRIQKMYNPIQKTSYTLQSILIHDGNAQSGHYYSYIYDQHSGIWRKYNDVNITQVDQEVVMKDSVGNGWISAYYLVYKRTRRAQNNLRNYAISSDQHYGKDYYSSLLSEQQKQQIRKSNQSFHFQIQSYKIKGQLTKVVQKYQKRFQSTNQLFRSIKKKRDEVSKKHNPPIITNILVFIKFYYKSQQLYKYYLMNSCIREIKNKDIDVNSVGMVYQTVFLENLKQKCDGFNQYKKPPFNYHLVTNVEKQYSDTLKSFLTASYMLKAINKQNWSEALGAIELLGKFTSGYNDDNYFVWLVKLIKKLVVLALYQYFQGQLVDKKLQQVAAYNQGLQSLKLLMSFCRKHFTQKQQPNLYNNLKFWFIQCLQPIPQQQKSIYNDFIKDFNSSDKRLFEYQCMFQKIPEDLTIAVSVQPDVYMWNFHYEQDILGADLTNQLQKCKQVLQPCNKLYNQLKKIYVPLNKQRRQLLLK